MINSPKEQLLRLRNLHKKNQMNNTLDMFAACNDVQHPYQCSGHWSLHAQDISKGSISMTNRVSQDFKGSQMGRIPWPRPSPGEQHTFPVTHRTWPTFHSTLLLGWRKTVVEAFGGGVWLSSKGTLEGSKSIPKGMVNRETLRERSVPSFPEPVRRSRLGLHGLNNLTHQRLENCAGHVKGRPLPCSRWGCLKSLALSFCIPPFVDHIVLLCFN